MAYKRSKARKQFESDLKIILATLKEADSPQCASAAVREYALCSGVLLTSAKLESYIEDLLGGWAASVQAGGVSTGQLPVRTRAFLMNQSVIISAYKRYIVEDDEENLLARLETQIGASHYDFAIDSRAVPAFPGNMIYAGRKYPSPKNFKRLFRRFGVNDVFAELNRLAQRDIEALLTSFNDIRTELAHVGIPVGQSGNDIRQRITDVKIIVDCVDRMFYAKVRSTVGPRCWVT